MYLMSQRGLMGGGYNKTCHIKNDDSAQPFTLGHSTISNPMPISYRFAYDSVTIPVTYINFAPQGIEKEFICIEE